MLDLRALMCEGIYAQRGDVLPQEEEQWTMCQFPGSKQVCYGKPNSDLALG